MTDEEKKTLENSILLQTQNLILQQDFSVLSLISFSYNKKLFFPEMYQMWYVSLVNISITKNESMPPNSHVFFGLDLTSASDIYSSILDSTGYGLIKNISLDNKPYVALDTLTQHLNAGIYFSYENMEKNHIIQLISNNYKCMKTFEELNSNNYSLFLKQQLSEKNTTQQKKI